MNKHSIYHCAPLPLLGSKNNIKALVQFTYTSELH